MVDQWPNLPFNDVSNGESPNPHAFDDWNHLYQQIFNYTTNNPTAKAPARYVMDLMFQSNEIINQLQCKLETTNLQNPPRPEQNEQTAVPNPTTTAPKFDPKAMPEGFDGMFSTWEEFEAAYWEVMQIDRPLPHTKVALWKDCVNAWNHGDTWETKSECEEACVLGEANHFAYDHDSTMDYEASPTPEHIPESIDGGSDEEAEEMETVLSDLRNDGLLTPEELVARSKLQGYENSLCAARHLNDDSILQDESSEEYVWDADLGEFVVVSKPCQQSPGLYPARPPEDSSSTEVSESPPAVSEEPFYFGRNGFE